MKILFLAPDTNLSYEMRGGAGTHMRASVTELRKLGHDVILAVGGDLIEKKNTNLDNFDNQNGFYFKSFLKKVIPAEAKKTVLDYNIQRKNKSVTFKTEQIIKSNPNIDVIYERSGYGYDTGMVLSEKYNIPRCMETDVIMLDLKKSYTSKLFNNFFYRWLEKKKYHSANSITVQSEYSVSLCKKYWNLNHDRVFNKDLGINKMNLELNPMLDVNKKHALKDKIVVGFVGYFMGYQNIPILLEAAKKFENISNDIIFLLVGGGGVFNDLQKKVEKDNIKNVIFTGLVDKQDVANYYDRIDLAVIPDCAYHMYPVKFLEYSLFKLPTITPNYKVFERFYLNTSKFKEMTFESKNIDSLVQKLKYSIDNIEKLKEEVNYTYDYVIENHKWERCAKLIENALIETLKFLKKNEYPPHQQENRNQRWC